MSSAPFVGTCWPVVGLACCLVQTCCLHTYCFREAPHQGFHSGCIQGFDVDSDCFVVWSDDSSQLIAVQFNQFVVEQTGDGQLMLKVPACTLRAVPSKYLSPDTAQQALVALTSKCSSCATWPGRSECKLCVTLQGGSQQTANVLD